MKRTHREHAIQQSTKSALALCSCYKMVSPVADLSCEGSGGGRPLGAFEEQGGPVLARQGLTEEESAVRVLKGSG